MNASPERMTNLRMEQASFYELLEAAKRHSDTESYEPGLALEVGRLGLVSVDLDSVGVEGNSPTGVINGRHFEASRITDDGGIERWTIHCQYPGLVALVLKRPVPSWAQRRNTSVSAEA